MPAGVRTSKEVKTKERYTITAMNKNKKNVYLRAAALGVISGMRSASAPASSRGVVVSSVWLMSLTSLPARSGVLA